jgi:hypothetical protein
VIRYGIVGGMANAICTYLMIWSTELAAPLEHAILFPTFSIAGIILSNLWGERIYKEVIHWKACQLCGAGLIVGTVDWPYLTSILLDLLHKE